MRNKLGNILMFLGAAMLAASVGLLLWNHHEATCAEEASADLLPAVSQAIEQKLAAEKTEDTASALVSTPPKMKAVPVNGHLCVGYLTIPKLTLELPVLAACTDTNLKISPCLYSGTTREDNLVLAAHNYNKHFGTLQQLTAGCEVIFVDMEGIANRYLVVAMDVVPPDAVEEVTSSQFDLALLTCTYGGKTRLVVYCDRQ